MAPFRQGLDRLRTSITCRVEAGRNYSQEYNVENRLAAVVLRSGSCSGAALATWNFFYDGDGNRVRQEYFQGAFGANVFVKVTNYYAGGTYELDQSGIVQADLTILISGTVTRRYYALGGQEVAMLECGPQGCGSGLEYFLTDNLGSVVGVLNSSGSLLNQTPFDPAQGRRYMPYGWVRTDVGSITQTDLAFTGQRSLDIQGNSFSLGLMDFKARMYDPYLARFIQPDTLTAGGPQGLNRYAYTMNNPINNTDPTGHRLIDDQCGLNGEDCGDTPAFQIFTPSSPSSSPNIPENPINPKTNIPKTNNGSSGDSCSDSLSIEINPLCRDVITHSASKQEIVNWLNSAALVTQYIALAVDGGFAIGEFVLMGTGCLTSIEAGCIPGVLAGAWEADAAYNESGMNGVETFFSWLSFGFTFASDIVDNGKIEKPTINSFITALMGSLMPDAIGDALIDLYGSGYSSGIFNDLSDILHDGLIRKR